MAPFESGDAWQARCERWSTLLDKDRLAAPLHAAMLEIRRSRDTSHVLVAQHQALQRYRETLIAETAKLVARIRRSCFSRRICSAR